MDLAFRTGFVRALGRRLYYESIGDGERGSLLGLHGGPGATHDEIRPIAAIAQFGYRVVLYDQLGCGRSERPRSYRGMTIQHLADEADAVRRALNLGVCHLFGYGFGGALAMQTVLLHPHGFKSLLVGSGFASMRQREDEVLRLVSTLPSRDRSAILEGERPGGRRGRRYELAAARFLRSHLSDLAVTPIDLALTESNSNQEAGRAAYGANASQLITPRATGTLAGWDIRRDLYRIRVPTLVTVGQRDHMTPACARTIHRAIRGSRLVVFRNSAHDSLFKEGDRYLRVVRDFLLRIGT